MDTIEKGIEKLDRVRQRIGYLRRDVSKMKKLLRSVSHNDYNGRDETLTYPNRTFIKSHGDHMPPSGA